MWEESCGVCGGNGGRGAGGGGGVLLIGDRLDEIVTADAKKHMM